MKLQVFTVIKYCVIITKYAKKTQKTKNHATAKMPGMSLHKSVFLIKQIFKQNY